MDWRPFALKLELSGKAELLEGFENLLEKAQIEQTIIDFVGLHH
jgi:hypothetical protein